MSALLEVSGLTKAFGDFVAVAGVDLTLPGGGITAVIGPNGAGKTTLINLLTGKLVPDRGRILFEGKDITRKQAHARVQAGMGRAFQVTNIFPRLTAEENAAIPVLAASGLAHRVLRARGALAKAREEARLLLAEVGLASQADLPAQALSHGDRRLLEIALALATKPRLIFLDEPTAGMAHGERQQVLGQIRRLAESGGVTFLLVEHDMDVVFGLANRIVVMHQGRVLVEGAPEAIRGNAQVQAVYLGESEATTAPAGQAAPRQAPQGSALLEVQDLSAGYGLSQVLRGVSFSVSRGEVVALLGRNGVGKTTTLRSLMGIIAPYPGSRVRLGGRDITGLAPETVARLGVGYVPDDRRIFPDLTVEENLRLPPIALGKKLGQWTVEEIAKLFPPLAALRQRKGRYLSGGEQKMLAIGRALMADPILLLLDEPSEGLSPLIVRILVEALKRVRERGVTLLLADQNLPFARRVADRAFILQGGRIVHDSSFQELENDPATIQKFLAV